MITGASTAALASVTTGMTEAGLIGVAVLGLVAGIAIFRHIRGAVR